jgi:hypothetical protein
MRHTSISIKGKSISGLFVRVDCRDIDAWGITGNSDEDIRKLTEANGQPPSNFSKVL